VPGYARGVRARVSTAFVIGFLALGAVAGVSSGAAPQAPPGAEAGPGASSLPVLVKAAPELVAGGQWFNSKPLTLASLRGKVVLLDFWTYSCINCLRTLPHLKAWYAAYHSDGLQIIGVHSPEFAFEHVASNVAAAIKRLGITYPVVQDNNFATWNAYANAYWPAEYLIDQQGRIREYRTGEGGYDETEQNIKDLLGVSNQAAPVPDTTPSEETTPESYLGYGRLDLSRYVGKPVVRDRPARYPARRFIPLSSLAYSGTWRVAKDVLGGTGRVSVTLAGRPAETIDVDTYKLYVVEHLRAAEKGLLQLKLTPGVRAYSFTFG
jgi:thiol-disulfide isomerase/thioredoxin